jgi:hypothetical protein
MRFNIPVARTMDFKIGLKPQNKDFTENGISTFL